MNEEQIKTLFSMIVGNYRQQLSKYSQEEQQNYFNVLRMMLIGKDSDLVQRNTIKHFETKKHIPQIADFLEQEESNYIVPGVEQTRLMIAQRDSEMPEQNVDKEFIKEQIRIAREKIAEVRLNELKRDFNKSFK